MIVRNARREDVELQNVGTTTFLGGLSVELSSEEVRKKISKSFVALDHP